MADHFRLDYLVYLLVRLSLSVFVSQRVCLCPQASVILFDRRDSSGSSIDSRRHLKHAPSQHAPSPHAPPQHTPSPHTGRPGSVRVHPPSAGIASATSSLQNLSTQHQKIKRAPVRFRPMGPKTGHPLSGSTNPDAFAWILREPSNGSVTNPLTYGIGATPGNAPLAAQLGFRHWTDILRRNDDLIKPNSIRLLLGPTVSDIAFQRESVRLQLLDLPPGDSGPMPD